MENEILLEEELPEELEQMLNAKQENGVYAGELSLKNLTVQKILLTVEFFIHYPYRSQYWRKKLTAIMLPHFMGVIRFTLGSVYHLAERAGLKFEKEAESYKSYKSYSCQISYTHARTLYMENESQLEEELPERGI